MKACTIKFSDVLLLDLLGLENKEDIRVYSARVDEMTGIITLWFTGEHPDIPEVEPYKNVPECIIESTRIISKIKLKGEENVQTIEIQTRNKVDVIVLIFI